MQEARRTDTSKKKVQNICLCRCYIVMCSSHVIWPKQHSIASLPFLVSDRNQYFISDKFLGLGSVISLGNSSFMGCSCCSHNGEGELAVPY